MRFHFVVYKNFIVVGYLLSNRVLMHLLCMPFRHFCDPVYFHIDFKDEHAMISSGTRVVRNTFWQLPSVFSPIPYAKPEKRVSVEPVCHPYYHQSEQEFRAELSARLAKVCNYSGKSSRR